MPFRTLKATLVLVIGRVFVAGLPPDPGELVVHADPRAPQIDRNAAGHRRWVPRGSAPGKSAGKSWENPL